MSQFNMTEDGNTLTLAPVGKIDAYNAPLFQNEVNEGLPGKTCVVFDFADLEYISSAGLRVIVATKKELSSHGEVYVRNASETIKEILAVTRLTQLVVVE